MPKYTPYVVQEGDLLEGIALKFGMSETSFVYPGLLIKVKSADGESGEEPPVTCSSSAPLKLPASYVTSLGEVQGVLSVTPWLVMFDPMVTDHLYTVRKHADQETKCPAVHFQACIDVQEIVFCAPILVPGDDQSPTQFIHFTLQPSASSQQRAFVTFKYEGGLSLDLTSICGFINRIVMECQAALPDTCTCLPFLDEVQPQVETPSTPLLSSVSSLLTEKMAHQLRVHLSPLLQLKTWRLVYSTSEHGYSYSALLANCHGRGPCLLVLNDLGHYIFGGFTSSSWEMVKGYYGTGDNFLFSFRDTDELHVYKPSFLNEYYQACDADCFSMGSDPKPGLSITKNLENGMSSACLTYENEPLASSEFFKILSIEIWAFD